MYDTLVGHCPHCGAPIYSPGIWHGVTPPPSIKSCMCVPTAQQYEIVTTTSIEIEEEKFKEHVKKLLDGDHEKYRRYIESEDAFRELDKEEEEKRKEKEYNKELQFYAKTHKGKKLLNLKEL